MSRTPGFILGMSGAFVGHLSTASYGGAVVELLTLLSRVLGAFGASHSAPSLTNSTPSWHVGVWWSPGLRRFR